MELNFNRTNRGGEIIDILRVKSDSETHFTGQTTVETPTSILIVKDVFDVIEKIRHTVDSEGNSYDWYLVKNHYRTQERFTPQREEQFDEDISETAQAVTDLEIEQMETAQTIMEHEIAIMELQEKINA